MKKNKEEENTEDNKEENTEDNKEENKEDKKEENKPAEFHFLSPLSSKPHHELSFVLFLFFFV